MGVMMRVVMKMAVDRNHAAGTGNRAAHMLELHRRVMDMEPVAQNVIHLVEDVIAPGWRHILDQDVATEGVRV